MSKLNYYAKTFIGRRKNNQDSYYAEEVYPGTYFAVADGMGGGVGGEIASSLAIEASINQIKILQTHDELKFILERVFIESHKSISEKIKENPELSGMGTTLTCLLIRDNRYVWGNIGDSRIYNLNESNFEQITIDHSYVQEYIDEKGEDPPLELVKNYGNIITRVLDGNNDEPDIFPLNSAYEELNANEIFVLCSDGLIVSKANHCNYIHNYILVNKKIEQSADELVSFAFNNNSNDNITIVIIENGKVKRKKMNLSQFKSKKTGQNKKPKSKLRYIVSFAFILSMIIGLYLIFGQDFIKNNFHKEMPIVDVKPDSIEKDKKEKLIEVKSFIGFEHTSLRFSVDNDMNNQITWLTYEPDEHLLNYEIKIIGGGLNNSLKLTKKTFIKLNELKIKDRGLYTLTINAVLTNDQKIRGDTELKLDIY